MASQPAKSTSFFTFGTGIMVGLGAALAMRATLPRATEFIGLVMQKMGFELGDILLALWDPEAQQAALPAPAPASASPKTKKKHPERKQTKSAHRNGKAPVLHLARRRRGNASAANGKTPKLPATRRLARAGVAARLN